MKSVDIRDVPCTSCCGGWNAPHSCDLPDYCSCIQSEQHEAVPGTEQAEDEDHHYLFAILAAGSAVLLVVLFTGLMLEWAGILR